MLTLADLERFLEELYGSGLRMATRDDGGPASALRTAHGQGRRKRGPQQPAYPLQPEGSGQAGRRLNVQDADLAELARSPRPAHQGRPDNTHPRLSIDGMAEGGIGQEHWPDILRKSTVYRSGLGGRNRPHTAQTAPGIFARTIRDFAGLFPRLGRG